MRLIIFRHSSVVMLQRIRGRRRLALAVSVGTVICAVIGCRGIETPREKIVGIWDFKWGPSPTRFVYRKDGTVIVLGPESDNTGAAWIPVQLAKWWFEDKTLVTDVELFTIEGKPRRVTRNLIAAIGDDRLVSGDDGSDWIRVTPTVARSSQFALILLGIAGLIALGAAIFGASIVRLRRMFLFLGASGVCMFLASAFGLPEAFAQTGDCLISWSSMRALRLPRDMFESAAGILFVGAFVWLVFSIRRSKTQR